MRSEIQIMQAAAELKAAGNYAEAESLLIGLMQSHPDFAPAYNSLGSLYFVQQQWKEAERLFRKAIEYRADYADAYYNLGLALTRLYRDTEALTVYQALLELVPQHPGALFQLGSLFMRQMQFQKAFQLFNQLLQDHPTHLESLVNIAACCLKLNKLAEARAYYLKVLALAPNEIQALFNLGVINMYQGLTDEAVDYYSKVIDIEPFNFEAQNNMGVAYLAKNDREKALMHFQKALHLQPENAALQHTVAVLSQTSSASDSPPEYIRSLFDAYAGRYDSHVKQALHYTVPELFKNMLEDVLKNKKDLDVLDLGCGTGLCGEIVKPWVRTLTGVDLSCGMLAMAKQKNCYTELVEASTLGFLTKADNKYDLVLAGDVLVYTGDLSKTLALIYRALKPGGLFIFNVEAGEGVPYRLATSGRFGHEKAYLDSLIKQTGFETLHFEVAALREQEGKTVDGYLYLLGLGN